MEKDVVVVSGSKECDFCGDPALYDGRTLSGQWGYMCEACFNKYGVGLGIGKGQRIVEKVLEE
jgi:hypothetical protein